MDTKFTPGPWKVTLPYTEGLNLRTVEQDTAADYRGSICNLGHCEHISGINNEEMLANATLIAAAPDMYEALKELLPCVGWSNFTDAELQREHELGNGAAIKIMKARAALAKVQP